MQTFRAFVINTFNLVSVIGFILALVVGGLTGWHGFEGQAMLQSLFDQLPLADGMTKQIAGAVVGVLLSWIFASIVFGLIYAVIDIQDGIRDLHRDLTKK